MATQFRPFVSPVGPFAGPAEITGFQKSLIQRRAAPSVGATLTVAQAMDALSSAIEPSEAEREKASKQQRTVRTNLERAACG